MSPDEFVKWRAAQVTTIARTRIGRKWQALVRRLYKWALEKP